MPTFTLSPTLNKNRVFILHKSEIEKRFDPAYYSHEFNEYDKKLSRKPFKKFHELIKSLTNGYDFRDYKDNGTPYLKVANIKQGEFDFSKLQYIDFDSSEISKSIQLKKGNILLTRKGTFGNAIALDKDYNYVISSEVFYIELKEGINPKFLEIFFNSRIGQLQFDKNKIGAIMGSLSQEAVKELKIPLLRSDVQNKIISIYDKYIDQKKQNEAQADKLLAGIDEYLLNELGIKLPSLPEDSLRNRMFMASFKELSGDRFDPNYNHSNNSKNISSIKKGKYPTFILNKISKSIFQGVGRNINENSKYVLLKVKNIKQNYEIDYEDTESIGDFPTNKLLYKGDIITPCIGEAVKQVKFSVFNRESNKYLVDNNTGVIRLNEKVNPDFINYCLCSSIGRLQVFRFIGGGGVPFLGADNLKKFIIPLPPLEKQKEIAKHINSIREGARKLKEKSNEALASASQEIEAILLN